MPFPDVPEITAKFVGQPYDLNSVKTPDQVWAYLDAGPEEVRQALISVVNILNSVVDGESGADNVAMTPIPAIGEQDDVQSIVEALVTILQSTVAGSSGAKFVGVETIVGLTGNEVQTLLAALKTYIDTHKTSSDHDSRYYTETELNAGQLDTRYYTETEINSKVSSAKGSISSIDGVDNSTGDVDLVGGTGITITPDNAGKKITITATGVAIPAPHASAHASGGADPVSPASIGAATQVDFDAHIGDVAEHLSLMTTQGDIIYQGASAPARLAKGTANQLLAMNSGATAPEWKTISGGWEKILVDNGTTIVNGTLTLASDTAQVDFTALDLDTYKVLRLMYKVLTTHTSANVIDLRINDDDIGNGNTQHLEVSNTTVTGTQSVSQEGFKINNLPSNSSTIFGTGEVDILYNNLNVSIRGRGNQASGQLLYLFSGSKNVAGAITKLRVKANFGSFKATSSFTLMGVK